MSIVIGHTQVQKELPTLSNSKLEETSLSFAKQYFYSSLSGNYFFTKDSRYVLTLYGNINIQKRFHTLWKDLDIEKILRDRFYLLTLFRSINGIYAITIFDLHDETIYLCADPLGFYPLYYCIHENHIVWSSEQKLILQSYCKPCDVNESAIDSYLYNGHLLANQSWFDKIHRIPAGQMMYFNLKSPNPVFQTFWSWSDIQKSQESVEFYIENYYEALENTIYNLDLPTDTIGISLSGGLDSRLLASIASQKYNIKSFTFSESNTRDLKIARRVANHLNISHQHYLISSEQAIEKRSKVFIEADGMLDLEHIHEAGLHQQLSNDYPIYINGFYGGGIYGGIHEINKRINTNIANKWFPYSGERCNIDSAFYDFPSIDPFIVDQKLRNQSAMSIYLLSKYSKIIIPFYDMDWLAINYAIPEEWQLYHKFYLKVLNKYLINKLNVIPWQKSMIPVNWQSLNQLAIKLRWLGIQQKVYNLFESSTTFINYQSILKQYRSLQYDEFNDHPAMKNLNPYQVFWRVNSIRMWKKYVAGLAQ